MNYRILTFDGGGMRGVVSLALLQRLQAEVDVLSPVDLFGGTSTGGLIALGLAAGHTPADYEAFYEQNGAAIFDRGWEKEILSIDELIGAKYEAKNLTAALTAKFGTAKLDDIPKRVIVPTFDLNDPASNSWKPEFLHNFPGVDSDGYLACVEVGLRTSAAPTYFPSHGQYIDGGMCANNPSLAAVFQTQDARAEIPNRPALSDIRLLSIGTGTSLSRVTQTNADWGISQWGPLLPSLFMDASVAMADYGCGRLLGQNYFRLAPPMPGTGLPMDSLDVQAMRDFGMSADITAAVAWVKANW